MRNNRTAPSRRQFLNHGMAVAAAGAAVVAGYRPGRAAAATVPADSLKGRIFKTLKIGMIKAGKSLEERFAAAKAAGFDGVELNSPGMDVEQTRQAIAQTGLPVDGTVCSSHWQIRHSSPDPKQRARALADLQTALRNTHAVGGSTVLLVVGHGKDGTADEVWKRSQDNIAQAIPLAAQLGVTIAIENVWNRFLYVHDGPNDQQATLFAKYVDQLSSAWVGMQYDIGNHWKYGNPGQWIRTLGRRIAKLDLKGFSRAKNSFTKIGEGDLPWSDVRQALCETGYTGWAAAEVAGGGPERLREIAANMDRVFGLV